MKIDRRAVIAAPVVLGIASMADAEVVASSVSTPQVDMVVVFKSKRRMGLYQNRDGKPVLLRSYQVDLGFEPNGDKARMGDGRTPEGTYFIDRRNENSAYHLSLGISYPNTIDVAEARSRGEDPGGDIFIHGGPTSLRSRFKRDWTAGCIAVSNVEIEQIWNMVPLGTVIVIRP